MRCRRIDSGGPSRSLKRRLAPGPEWRRQHKSGGRPASPQDYWPQRLLPRATSSIALARVRPRWEAARVDDRAAVESGRGSHSGALILGLSTDGPQEAAAATAPTRVATARLLQPPVTPKEVQFRPLFFEGLHCWTGFSDPRCERQCAQDRDLASPPRAYLRLRQVGLLYRDSIELLPRSRRV